MRSRPVLAALLLAAAAFPSFGAAHADDGDAKAPKHKVTQSDSYIMIDPMYSAILDGDRPIGMLMIGVGIDVPDPTLRGEAQHAMPVLRDAYLRNLMSFSSTAVRAEQQPDVTVIADRLQGVTDRALGRKGARVLLAQVAIRITK
jgi:flagellar basal body-associated protein FliL